MTALCRDCFAVFETPPSRCLKCASARLVSHPELELLTIAHLDCDAFYASVEKRDRPELRDRPVIVGGRQRGVVTAACYLARVSGVRSAMPMFEARRLCPEAEVIAPDFAKYRATSRQIFDRVRALTPQVSQLALDEAWLDLAGTQRLHGAPPSTILARLQAEIEQDVGVTVSIGLAGNRFLAKIASEMDKPRGFAVIGKTGAEAFLAPRPVDILPGVGKVFARMLEAKGYGTVGDLARANPGDLARQFGNHGLSLWRLAHGQGSDRIGNGGERRSISAETTFEADISQSQALEARLGPLCDRVARTARDAGLSGRIVVLKLRHADFRILTRRMTLVTPTQTSKTLFDTARDLLARAAVGQPFRLIGVGLTGLAPESGGARELFPAAESRARTAEALADRLRERFGERTVVNGRRLARSDLRSGRSPSSGT